MTKEGNSMNSILIKNCRIIDITHQEPSKPCDILISNGIIKKISQNEIKRTNDTTLLDCCDHYLLPGFIDAHVHVTAARTQVANLSLPQSEVILRAKEFMENMLQRGFTTIRDAGGADCDLAYALKMGLIKGPRLFYSGKALSQTGGHGDFRDQHDHFEPCFCHKAGSNITIVADGVPGVLKAAREQLRQGASQIKIMASGGVNSPTDKIDSLQYTPEEIAAIVNVAKDSSTYVMAHAYMPDAIERCLNAGVRSIEHGNMLNEKNAIQMQKQKAYLVPTLAVYHVMAEYVGKDKTLSNDIASKLTYVKEQGEQSIAIAKNYGVAIGFGTDLLGEQAHSRQTDEFKLQAAVQTPYETLISATAVNAEILQCKDKLGVIKEGAAADIVFSKVNPLENINVLATDRDNISLVIKGGEIVKNQLN